MLKILALGFALFSPLFALAHTRWFAEGNLPPYVTGEPTSFYLTVFGLAALTAVLVGVYFERRKWFQFGFLAPLQPHAFEHAASRFTIAVGAFFILVASHQNLFSPNLTIETGIPVWALYLQLLVGISFLVGAYPRFFALILAALWGMGFVWGGGVAMAEDVWVFSTAAFVFLMGNDHFALFPMTKLDMLVAPFKRHAHAILRIGVGLTLIALGFSEKLLHPEFGVNFLSQYHWNFFASLGMSDYLFTLLAGSVEAFLGLVFVLGIVTRLNALVTAVFFIMPLFILGIFGMELNGHFPHFVAVIVLLLFGSGRTHAG